MIQLFLFYSACTFVVSAYHYLTVVATLFLFVVSSLGFTIALHLGFFGFWKFLCWVVFIDCIGIGLCIASVMWIISNNFFLNKRHETSFPVEWAYAFDVHLNALFPFLIILHGIQLLLFGGKE